MSELHPPPQEVEYVSLSLSLWYVHNKTSVVGLTSRNEWHWLLCYISFRASFKGLLGIFM